MVRQWLFVQWVFRKPREEWGWAGEERREESREKEVTDRRRARHIRNGPDGTVRTGGTDN